MENSNKKIFYIEEVEFLRSMMTLAFKTLGVEIYTLDSIQDKFYLIDDLAPDLILFNVTTTKNELDQIAKLANKVILVGTGTKEDQVLVESITKNFIIKPFIASSIALQVLSFLNESP